jgi:hypothetical protein
MLCIENEPLTDSDLAYIAMRMSFLETLERIVLAEQMGLTGSGAFGFLAEVPYLRHVAPPVQLDLLLECWSKLRSPEKHAATLVDESVVYAACEAAARIIDSDADFAKQYLSAGPRKLHGDLTGPLADELRFLHLCLPNEGHFLLLSQFQDVDPEAGAKLKMSFGLDPAACEAMFEVLGRWHVSPAFRQNSDGLLAEGESAQAVEILGLNRIASPR